MKEKRYNTVYNSYVELKEGEEFCPLCKGRGRVVGAINERFPSCARPALFCHKCLGTGKLDWIEKVIGKKPTIPEHMTSCGHNYQATCFTVGWTACSCISS
jgi:hypothetical protein